MIILEIKAKLDDGSEHLRVITAGATLQQIDDQVDELEKKYPPNAAKCKWITTKLPPLYNPYIVTMR